jgi:hypothetical protein
VAAEVASDRARADEQQPLRHRSSISISILEGILADGSARQKCRSRYGARDGRTREDVATTGTVWRAEPEIDRVGRMTRSQLFRRGDRELARRRTSMRRVQLTTLTAFVLAWGWLQLFAGPAGAEVDPAAALVGRWEGSAEVPSPQYLPTRVLLVKNVGHDATVQGVGKWKADGAYGVTADKLARVDIAITAVESTVTVEFITPLALHARLKLVKPNVLEGTLSAAGGGRAYRIQLERRQ